MNLYYLSLIGRESPILLAMRPKNILSVWPIYLLTEKCQLKSEVWLSNYESNQVDLLLSGVVALLFLFCLWIDLSINVFFSFRFDNRLIFALYFFHNFVACAESFHTLTLLRPRAVFFRDL
jgi:hypothetical protein